MNRKNLKKLADYLADLPEGGPQFDMGMYYFDDDNSYSPRDLPEIKCGTAACAAGHATHIKGLEAYEDETDWRNYIMRVFGIHNSTEEYYWCFSGAWDSYDNTPTGASKRITYLLEYGVPGAFTRGHDYEESVPFYQ